MHCLFCKGNPRLCKCQKREEIKENRLLRLQKLKNPETLWQFQFCLIQRSSIAEELFEASKQLQESKDVKDRKMSFLFNAFLHSRFFEKDILVQPEPKTIKEVVLDVVEVVNPLNGQRELFKQSPKIFKPRQTIKRGDEEIEIFPKEYEKNYGWPTNSEIVYSELEGDEKVDKSLFDKDYYPRLDRRQFKSHDADGISTYTSRTKEISREDLAKDSPKDFTKSKGGIVQRKQRNPKYKKGQYLKGLGREKEKKIGDFLHNEREELIDSFKGITYEVVIDEKPKIAAKKETPQIVLDYLERIRNGQGQEKEKAPKAYKQRTYHSLFMEKK